MVAMLLFRRACARAQEQEHTGCAKTDANAQAEAGLGAATAEAAEAADVRGMGVYLDCLPETFGSVATWPAPDKLLLCGTSLGHLCHSAEFLRPQTLQALAAAFRRWDEAFAHPSTLRQHLTQALLLVQTRSFSAPVPSTAPPGGCSGGRGGCSGGGDASTVAMVPLVDFLNHCSDPARVSATVIYRASSAGSTGSAGGASGDVGSAIGGGGGCAHFSLLATKRIAAGQPVTFQYGRFVCITPTTRLA